jgi:hypothetical protein
MTKTNVLSTINGLYLVTTVLSVLEFFVVGHFEMFGFNIIYCLFLPLALPK